MMNKTVAIYLRVSTDSIKNGNQQTTEPQKLEIVKYLESRNITDYQIYEDLGISGTKKDRPALKKLMNDCRNGKVSMVCCFKLDRLFRSLKNMLEYVTEFQELGVEFVAVKDNIDLSSAAGRLLFQIIACFGEFEAAVTRERVMSGLANARSKGIKLGRPFKPGHSVVKKLRGEGKSVSEIADHVGLSRKTVYRSLGRSDNV